MVSREEINERTEKEKAALDWKMEQIKSRLFKAKQKYDDLIT